MSEGEKPKETKKEEEGKRNSGNDDITCRECGEKGHISYNCPQVKCYNCGQFGHKSYDCTRKQRGYQRGRGGYRSGYGYGYGGGYGNYGGGRYRDSKCYNCGKYGHKSFECDKPSGKNCYVCGKPGHISNNCPEKKEK